MTLLRNVQSFFRSVNYYKYNYSGYVSVICYIYGSRKRIFGFLRTISGYFCVDLYISLLEGDYCGLRMMGSSGMKCCIFVIVFLFLSTSFEASPFISDGIFGSHNSGERRLLQAKTQCPVNFEFQNYTIITSKCKGPEYPPDLCCSSFKDFACPFVDYLNDLRNDCAATMFSYINLNGKYPAGLFASICREGKEGLECPELPASSAVLSEKANKNLSGNKRELLPITMLLVASLASTLQYFLSFRVFSSQ